MEIRALSALRRRCPIAFAAREQSLDDGSILVRHIESERRAWAGSFRCWDGRACALPCTKLSVLPGWAACASGYPGACWSWAALPDHRWSAWRN